MPAENFFYKHRRALLIVAIMFFIFIIIISIFNITWQNLHSAKINLLIAPTIASVKIGDDTYSAVGEYNIIPGNYNVMISADGFESKTGSLTAVAGETTEISLYLTPTAENSDWYATHPGDALIMGEIKNTASLANLDELKSKNPILNQLPLEIDYFTAGYAHHIKYTISYLLNDDNTAFTLTITDYTGGNYDDAVSKLAARGVNLETVTIQYINATADSLAPRAVDGP